VHLSDNLDLQAPLPLPYVPLNQVTIDVEREPMVHWVDSQGRL
jgi:hypothetical protein